MGESPSIKGTALVDLVADVGKLLEAGSDEAEERLMEQDLEIIGKGISDVGWYCIHSYARMLELMRDVEGGGSNQYVIDRGRARGRKLMDAGLYHQMEYLGRMQVSEATTPEERMAAYGRDLRLLVTLSRSILNFSTWTVEVDPSTGDRHRIKVTEAEEFPDILGYSSEGFIDAMSSLPGQSDLWKYQRVSRGVVEFRMTRTS